MEKVKQEFDEQLIERQRKSELTKSVIKKMMDDDIFTPGEQFEQEEFLELLGVEKITDKDFKNYSPKELRQKLKDEDLAALSVIGLIKANLIKKGRHFYQANGFYRVALPCEIKVFADKYVMAAQRKLSKASILSKHIPVEHAEDNIGRKSKMMLMEKAIKKHTLK